MLPVLVIDDELSILGAFEKILKRKGIPFDLAESTGKGIDFINQKPYGLIFTDLNQNPSGLDVFLYAQKKGIETYIMSGGADADILKMAKETAGDHFFQKPFEIPTIIKILETYKSSQS